MYRVLSDLRDHNLVACLYAKQTAGIEQIGSEADCLMNERPREGACGMPREIDSRLASPDVRHAIYTSIRLRRKMGQSWRTWVIAPQFAS
jgi:hypothetical protein